jgi:hypothetical protein
MLSVPDLRSRNLAFSSRGELTARRFDVSYRGIRLQEDSGSKEVPGGCVRESPEVVCDLLPSDLAVPPLIIGEC